MEFTDEQKRFYERIESLSNEEKGKILCEARECVKNTGFNYTLSLVNGKYKMTILYTIAQFGTIRTNEMQRYIQDVSFKTLSANLKELERDGLIIRKEYRQVPPKVEYSLTERGETLIPILNTMCAWGYNHQAEDLKVKLDEAQAWAASVGYTEEDVDGIIKSVRKNKRE